MKPFGRKTIQAFLALPYARKWLVAETLAVLWIVRMAVWFLPYKWLHQLILRWNRGGFAPMPMMDNGQAVIDTVRSASHYVPDATCLTQAISGQILLSRQKVSTTLNIGVKRPESLHSTERLLAHAWLECNGQVILGDRHDLSLYVRLPVLSVQRPANLTSPTKKPNP